MKKTINSISEQFWLRKFSEATPDYQFPWYGEDRALTSVTRPLPTDVSAGVQKITKGNEKSEFVFYTAALSLCISRYCHLREVTICTVANEEVLPLHIPVKDQNTYQEHLKHTGSIYLEALNYTDYSFEEFLGKLNLRIGSDHSKVLKKVLFTVGKVPALIAEHFEMVINLRKEGSEVFLDVLYWDHLEHRAIFDGFMESLLGIIANTKSLLAIDLAKVSVLSSEQIFQVTELFNAGYKAHPEATFLQLFSEHVSTQPDQVALIYKEDEVSYKTLDERSNAVASRLL
ncbi:MAG: hypothetical protein AAFO69_02530, partial [Bacteroidota bacterium]